MPCEYDNEYKCGDSLYDLTKKILGRLKQIVGFGPGGGGGVGGDVTLTVSDVEIGAVEIKDSSTDNRATVRNTDPVASDFGLVVRNIPSGVQAVSGPLTDAQLSARVNTLGQKVSGSSTPVVLSTSQESILTNIFTQTGGFSDVVAPTFATVGVTSAEAVAENIQRISVYLTNTSDNIISLAFGTNAAVLNSGITLFPGDSFVLQRPALYYTGAINAIASAAASNLSIQEFNTV